MHEELSTFIAVTVGAFVIAAASNAGAAEQGVKANGAALEPSAPLSSICRVVRPEDVIVRQGEAPEIWERDDDIYIRNSNITINLKAKCSTPDDKIAEYKFGIIQQFNYQMILVRYAHGVITLELPQFPILDTGCAAGDVNCLRGSPWYNDEPISSAVLRGLLKDADVTLTMRDQPDVTAAWQESLPPYGKLSRNALDLKSVERKAKITTWVVVERLSDSSLFPIARIDWGIDQAVPIDSTRDLGARAVESGVISKSPPVRIVLRDASNTDDGSWLLPVQATLLPQVNNALQLYWNPVPGGAGQRVRMR